MRSLLSFVITTFVLSHAWGQADVMILNNTNQQTEVRPSTDTSMTNRYTVKPRPKPVKVNPTPTPLPAPKVQEEPTEGSDKNFEQATTLPAIAPDPRTSEQEKANESGMLERARDFMMGGSPEILDEYRSYLQPDDLRRNIIDIYLSPFFVYNDSSSPSFARSYNNFMPGISLSNDIWFTMFFGLSTSYKRTLAGSVVNTPGGTSFADASHEWASLGLRFRRFYGYGKSVPSLTFGMDMAQYMLRVPSDDPNRLKLTSTGLRLSLEAKIPSGQRYLSTYGLEMYPLLTHTEATTGTAVRSGGQNNSFAFGLSWGGEYKLERTSRLFWKSSYQLQRSLFSGSATGADPVSGVTLSNVPVNNSFLMFEFGYVWGK